MNKFVLSIVIVAVVAIALSTAGFVFAQAPTPTTPGTDYGFGMMGGRGARGGRMGQYTTSTQDGLLHDEMVTAFAQKLGISIEDLNTRIDKGETMAQIAFSKGLTADQFSTLMIDTRNQVVDLAVKNGTLTQTQADWMKQRSAGFIGGGRGMRGNGQGRNADPNCPYYQTNP